MQKYIKRDGEVTAVQLDIETEGLDYIKWGGEQHAKQNDWLVNNEGEVYTVDDESFMETYTFVSPGRYKKTVEVWAEEAGESGWIETKEGTTHYSRGDMLVFNGENRTDGYAIDKTKFDAMYMRID